MNWFRSGDSAENASDNSGSSGVVVSATTPTPDPDPDPDPDLDADAPTISNVTPSSGSWRGGYLVTITGTNFDSPSATFCGEVCTLPLSSETNITCTMPELPPGETCELVITNVSEESVSLASAFNSQVFVYNSENMNTSRKITRYSLSSTGALSSPTTSTTLDTSFMPKDLLVRPSHRLLTALAESTAFGGQEFLKVFSIHPSTGALAEINTGALGTNTTALCASSTSVHAIETNATMSQVYTYSLDSDGGLGTSNVALAGAGAGACAVASGVGGQHYVYVLNSMDTSVSAYLDMTGILLPIGSGAFTFGRDASSLAVSSDGKFLILPSSQHITVLGIGNLDGTLTPVSEYTFPGTYSIYDIKVASGGRFFVSLNKGLFNSIETFEIDGAGTVTSETSLPLDFTDISRMLLGPNSLILTQRLTNTLSSYPLDVDGYPVTGGAPIPGISSPFGLAFY